MATPRIPAKTQQTIRKMAAKGTMSLREIARALGVHHTTVLRYSLPVPPEAKKDLSLEAGIRDALKYAPMPPAQIASDLGVKVKDVRNEIRAMQERGVLIIEMPGGIYSLTTSVTLEPGHYRIDGSNSEWTHRFGVTSDNHLCNKHSRLDVLKSAYEHFERSGITTVFNCGNWIDGEARFNKGELLTAPGMDAQLDYLIDKWPVHKGIKTLYIAGDDHEGWYQQREGIEIGKYLQMRAQQQGRSDLQYLGYAECDIELAHRSGSAIMRVVHPGGGSAYAVSYTDQKRTESYQGGEKPHIELVGHYHKFNQGYPREVHTVQVGCTSDQSLFMRKKRIQAHLGFCEIKIKQNQRGAIERFAVEWFPFYDRGYYGKKY